MKNLLSCIFVILGFMAAFSQQSTPATQDTLMYRIVKNDGGELIGKILQKDAREILVRTIDNREIYIPQHVIKELIPLDRKSTRLNSSHT